MTDQRTNDSLPPVVQGGKRIVFLGATGAVGGHAAQALLDSPTIERLTLLGRRDATLSGSEQRPAGALVQHRIDVMDPNTYDSLLQGHDTAICTLGVGQPSTMSREDFVRIDKTAVLDFATACKASGVGHFLLLSSVGTSSDSRSFYLRTKGELEDGLAALGFDRLSLFHPSMILTPTNRYGVSQAVTLKLWPALSALMFGPLRRYRGVKVEQLGRAMAACALQPGDGQSVFEWGDFQRLGT